MHAINRNATSVRKGERGRNEAANQFRRGVKGRTRFVCLCAPMTVFAHVIKITGK